ncbi:MULTISPECIES: hypothetical protein [Microvirga]|uniref:Uncharacterized protein n=2 Tax=Microvirga TaxID=186650 RepID=A0ABW9Z6Z2_9HYPH|nr:hypothetical protein [Microvirga arsenatis]NBJ12802.1 hypothetical protein [Microvirga arsenatis]NBJ26661.1 hypothetical protein [Microvirga arsenatis]
MALWVALSRLLTIMAVVSLVVVGGSSAASAAAGFNAPIVTTADDMSCCDQTPPDCSDMKACPFAVLCIAKCPQNMPTAGSALVRSALAAELAPYFAQRGDSLPALPPDHPPKA